MVVFNDLKVKKISENETVGSYEFSPLPRGYGHTLANSLRRILLSSMEGAAVTSVRINGVEHEYTTIEGMKEDVLEMIMNIKDVRFKCVSDEPQACVLEVKGKKDVTAADIKTTGEVEVMTPDAHIASLTTAGATISIEIVVEKGVGYRESAEGARSEVGRIPMDADFTPVKMVSYDVTRARKGQDTDWDGVVMQIETDGSIGPRDALLEAAKILQDFAGKTMAALGVPIEEVDERAEASQVIEEEVVEEETVDNEVLSWKVEDLPVSKRSKTGLLAGGFETVGDIAKAPASDLLSLPGFGNKSLNEVIELLNQYGIEIQM